MIKSKSQVNSQVNLKYNYKYQWVKQQISIQERQGQGLVNPFFKKQPMNIFTISQKKKGKTQVFFEETEKKHVSRSLFLDMNPKSIQRINLNTQKYAINQDNLFKGSGLFSDLFVTGHYLDGAEMVHQSIQNVRKEVGFLNINSLGGGTGSGMSSSMLQRLRQSYCQKIVEQHCVLPQTQTFYSPIQIYNTVLSFNSSIQLSDICILAQNEAFSQRLLYEKQMRPSINDINQVHAENICEITGPYRFGGNLNTSQRKTCVNLLMFPRMKFMISSFSSKIQKFNHLDSTLNPRNFSKANFFKDANGSHDIYTMQVSCRDNFITQNEIDAKAKMWIREQKLTTTDWIVQNLSQSITQPPQLIPSSSMLINSRHVVKIFERWCELFCMGFRRNAFLHGYLSGGMDKMEFTEAESNLNDIISEYTPYSYSADEDEYFDQQNGQSLPQ